MNHRYAIARMTEDGEWIQLDSFRTMRECDQRCDAWADRYPNAYVDVIDLVTGEVA